MEAGTDGGTTAGMNAGIGGSPGTLAGTPAVLKRWSGSPGKTGKSIKHKTPKMQSARDNPVTNPGVGNNLVS